MGKRSYAALKLTETGVVFTNLRSADDTRKEKGDTSRGDSWFNTAPVIALLLKMHVNLQLFFSCIFIATFKLDGFQTGVTIAKDEKNEPCVESFWSRNRLLTAEEISGNSKIGNAGQMGGAYDVFKTFSLKIAHDIFHRDERVAKVTVTGEGYRASYEKQSAQFASIHPFQLILELGDETEIVLLMTPSLHEFMNSHGTYQKGFRDVVEMNQFLVNDKQHHVFPTPILHIGNLHECIRAGHRLAMNVHESYVEGIMISLADTPNFVMKLKTPQQMKGEFSSIKRLAPLGISPDDAGNMLCIEDQNVRDSYQLLVDIYDEFLKFSEEEAKAAAEAKKASNGIVETLIPMVDPAFKKFLISDSEKPPQFDLDAQGYLTQQLPKREFFTFLGKVKDFVLKEIEKNHSESSGQEIDKNTLKTLTKYVQDFLGSQFLAPSK